ncbi:MAG: hypothetical protein ACI8SE_001885 [Bacteroidia bacterium]|jgi:hypothetical protein
MFTNKPSAAVQKIIYRFLCKDIDFDSFKKHLSSDPQAATFIGSTLADSLMAAGESNQKLYAEVKQRLNKYGLAAHFEKYRIQFVLYKLTINNDDFIPALYDSYELYADGYFFLETIGVHGLSFANTYFDYFEWEKLPEAHKKSSIDINLSLCET